MNDMSLKARLKNMAKERNISAQSVLQIYLMNLLYLYYGEIMLEVRKFLLLIKNIML